MCVCVHPQRFLKKVQNKVLHIVSDEVRKETNGQAPAPPTTANDPQLPTALHDNDAFDVSGPRNLSPGEGWDMLRNTVLTEDQLAKGRAKRDVAGEGVVDAAGVAKAAGAGVSGSDAGKKMVGAAVGADVVASKAPRAV